MEKRQTPALTGDSYSQDSRAGALLGRSPGEQPPECPILHPLSPSATIQRMPMRTSCLDSQPSRPASGTAMSDIQTILATDCGSTTTKAILIERRDSEYRLVT